jgi:DNA repair exonuclease SbcCD nuclease subunit
VDAVTLTHTVQAIVELCEAGHQVYLLPGNHDANSVTGGRFIVEAFGAMNKDNIHVIGEHPGQSVETDVSDKVLAFWPIAFKTISETRTELEDIRQILDKQKYNVLLMHNSVSGAVHLGWECDDGLDPDEVCAGFDLVYSGHFHRHQHFGSNGMYVGSPMQHNYGDVGSNGGCWLVEFTKQPRKKTKVKQTFVELNSPCFHIFSDLKEFKKAELKSGDYARLEVSMAHAEWVESKTGYYAVCDNWKKKGVNAEVRYIPTYHHESRLEGSTDGDMDGLSLEKAIATYVHTSDVVTEGLSKSDLIVIGRRILNEIKMEQGYDATS